MYFLYFPFRLRLRTLIFIAPWGRGLFSLPFRLSPRIFPSFPWFPQVNFLWIVCRLLLSVVCFPLALLERAISISSLLLLFYFRSQLPRVQFNCDFYEYLCVFLQSRELRIEKLESQSTSVSSLNRNGGIIWAAITLSGLWKWTLSRGCLLWSFPFILLGKLQLELWFSRAGAIKCKWKSFCKVKQHIPEPKTLFNYSYSCIFKIRCIYK